MIHPHHGTRVHLEARVWGGPASSLEPAPRAPGGKALLPPTRVFWLLEDTSDGKGLEGRSVQLSGLGWEAPPCKRPDVL